MAKIVRQIEMASVRKRVETTLNDTRVCGGAMRPTGRSKTRGAARHVMALTTLPD